MLSIKNRRAANWLKLFLFDRVDNNTQIAVKFDTIPMDATTQTLTPPTQYLAKARVCSSSDVIFGHCCTEMREG